MKDRLRGRVMFFFFQAEDGIRDLTVTGVQTCALPISGPKIVPSPPTRVISTTSPDMVQCTSVSEAIWNTIALVPPAIPASVAESTKEIGRASCRERV